MGELGTYCEGCRHLGMTGYEKTCDYLLDTGTRRPCPAGEGCTEHTAKSPKKEYSRAPQPGDFILSGRKEYKKLDKDKARELYDQGLSDRKIADALGVHKDTVAAWRKKEGLPSGKERGIAKVQKEEKHVKKEFGLAAEVPVEQKKMPTEQGEMPAKAEEMPADTETLTVKALSAIVGRLLGFGLGEVRLSIGGKPLGDFKRVTVELDGGVRIDLS